MGFVNVTKIVVKIQKFIIYWVSMILKFFLYSWKDNYVNIT
jgi:hypothetical protein